MVSLKISGKNRVESRGCVVIEIEDSADLGGPFDRAAGVGEPFVGQDHPVADTLVWPAVIVEVAVAPGDVGGCKVCALGTGWRASAAADRAADAALASIRVRSCPSLSRCGPADGTGD